MLWFVYWDGHYVGTVIAKDEDEAKHRAHEKFEFTDLGMLEVKPRLKSMVEV